MRIDNFNYIISLISKGIVSCDKNLKLARRLCRFAGVALVSFITFQALRACGTLLTLVSFVSFITFQALHACGALLTLVSFVSFIPFQALRACGALLTPVSFVSFITFQALRACGALLTLVSFFTLCTLVASCACCPSITDCASCPRQAGFAIGSGVSLFSLVAFFAFQLVCGNQVFPVCTVVILDIAILYAHLHVCIGGCCAVCAFCTACQQYSQRQYGQRSLFHSQSFLL